MTYFEQQEKIREQAKKYIEKKGYEAAYDFATWILHRLQGHGYCIWQTYTKDDIESNIGRKPTDDEMQDLADSLQCFENIRNI